LPGERIEPANLAQAAKWIGVFPDGSAGNTVNAGLEEWGMGRRAERLRLMAGFFGADRTAWVSRAE
jgi:hypothetical protein